MDRKTSQESHAELEVDTISKEPSEYELGIQASKLAVVDLTGYGNVPSKVVKTLRGHEGRVINAIFLPDGERILSMGEDNKIILWSVATGKQLWSVATGKQLWSVEGTGTSLEVMSVNPEGDKVAASGRDTGGVLIWKIGELDPPSRLRSDRYLIEAISFSPNKGKLASVITEKEKVTVWDYRFGEKTLETSALQSQDILAIAYNTDGKFIASGSRDKSIVIWDALTGKFLRSLDGHEFAVEKIEFSQYDDSLIALDWSQLVVWNPHAGKISRVLASGLMGGTKGIGLNSDGKILVSSVLDKVKFWDVQSGEEIQSTEVGLGINSFAFSPDGKSLITGHDDQTIKVWN